MHPVFLVAPFLSSPFNKTVMQKEILISFSLNWRNYHMISDIAERKTTRWRHAAGSRLLDQFVFSWWCERKKQEEKNECMKRDRLKQEEICKTNQCNICCAHALKSAGREQNNPDRNDNEKCFCCHSQPVVMTTDLWPTCGNMTAQSAGMQRFLTWL